MSTYNISTDRKTITISLDHAIPGTSADDAALDIVIEQAQNVLAVRYITSDVVGVIRAYMAGQVHPDSTPIYPNIEALFFANVSQFFVANVAQHYPASIVTALSNAAAAKAALSNAILTVIGQQALL